MNKMGIWFLLGSMVLLFSGCAKIIETFGGAGWR